MITRICPPQTNWSSINIYNDRHIHFGAWVGTIGGGLQMETFSADAQKTPSICHWYQQWDLASNSPFNVFSGMDTARDLGQIPMVTWEPWSAGGATSTTFTCANIATGTTVMPNLNVTFDSYITAFAQAAASWGHPFFLRPMHEFNLNGTYPWDYGNGNSAADFVNAWKHMHDIFVANGATNILWVWAPNFSGGYTDIISRYPGDDYVDVIGFDGYNHIGGGWINSLTDIYYNYYGFVTNNVSNSKPMFITETGCLEAGGDKAAWLRTMLGSELKTFPLLRGIVYFNEDPSGTGIWRIETTDSAKAAFAAIINTSQFLTNNFAEAVSKSDLISQ